MTEHSAAKLLHPKFEATFNLGQVAQIIAVLSTVIGAYFAMSADIKRLDERAVGKFVSIEKRLDSLDTVVTRLTETAIIIARQDEKVLQIRSELDRLRLSMDQALRGVK